MGVVGGGEKGLGRFWKTWVSALVVELVMGPARLIASSIEAVSSNSTCAGHWGCSQQAVRVGSTIFENSRPTFGEPSRRLMH